MNTIERLQMMVTPPWVPTNKDRWVMQKALPDLLRVAWAVHRNFSKMPAEVLDALEPLFREVAP